MSSMGAHVNLYTLLDTGLAFITGIFHNGVYNYKKKELCPF